jgi:hypothetical protein
MASTNAGAKQALRVGVAVPLLNGDVAFYPVDYLYRICPMAPSLGDPELEEALLELPPRMG